MAKNLLKGVALGGLLAGLAVWAHTTPKGKLAKAKVETQVKSIWAKMEKEYKKLDPEGVKDMKKHVRAALRSWQTSKEMSGDVKKALGWLVKKVS